MKNLTPRSSRTSLSVVVLPLAMLAASASLLACAGDDTNPPAPPVSDAGTAADATTDGSKTSEAGQGTETGTDSSTSPDSASDANASADSAGENG